MKTILKNGKIYIEKNSFGQAAYIEDGTIRQVGSNTDILSNKADKIIDLEGKTVLPGLNDSHLHLLMLGEAMSTCNLDMANSIEDIIKIGREYIDKNPNVTCLYGRGWNQDSFSSGDRRLLNRHDLDKISTEVPVIFDRICIHVSAANTKTLEILGIDQDTFVDGGTIELDYDGKPNGIFTENAIRIAHSLIPKKSTEQIESSLLKAIDYALSVGLTSVQSCDVMTKDFQTIFNIIRNLHQSNRMKLRYSHQFNFQDIEDFKSYLETEYKSTYYDEKFISKGVLKLFKDGSLGGRTALMLKDYEDAPGVKGVEALSDPQLQDLCNLATRNGITVITHGIGNGAIESIINAYEKTMIDGKNPLRHGIVHCQITSQDQLDRIAKLQIPIMYQPIFLDYDIKIVESRVGKELARSSYAFNTLRKLGSPISFGTDAPVENCNPFPNIYCAVTRKDLVGNPPGGFQPQEKMDLVDVIDAYTLGGAFNEFKENFKGRLKPDYVADLIVLDRDIFTIDQGDIKDIKVEKTMINGEFVYER